MISSDFVQPDLIIQQKFKLAFDLSATAGAGRGVESVERGGYRQEQGIRLAGETAEAVAFIEGDGGVILG
ncbi:MAG TPA: hypothetical protein VK446_01590, partial [Methylocystis sp.]|nr:hypothetical protein [Methylocystis sp.]